MIEDGVNRADEGEPRVALVTGATGGLGTAIVRRLRASAWRVEEVGHQRGRIRADLGSAAQARSLVASVTKQRGGLGLLVVCHARLAMAPIDAHEPADWWRVVDVNLSGAFTLAREAAKPLRASRGSIVFVSSEWGVTGWPRASAYAASKAGLIGLTRSLARELAPRVRVNAVAPGVIDTPQLEVDARDLDLPLAEMKDRYAAATPLGRIASPEEVAATIGFLASRDAAYYTGQVFHPNGGTTMAS